MSEWKFFYSLIHKIFAVSGAPPPSFHPAKLHFLAFTVVLFPFSGNIGYCYSPYGRVWQASGKLIAMIDALPELAELTADPPSDADPEYVAWLAKTQQTLTDIREAKAAYDALTDEEKAQIGETRTAKLMELAALAEQMALMMPMTNIASGTFGNCDWMVDSVGTLTISPTTGTDGILGIAETSANIPWYSVATSIKKAVVSEGVKATSTQCLFAGLKNCTEIDIGNLDTSNATDMTSMFNDCSSLATLDVSSLDTTNVVEMDAMFRGLKSITTLDVSNLKTGNVETLSTMFAQSESLTELDLSNFDTSNVKNMNAMFVQSKALTTINLTITPDEGWQLEKVLIDGRREVTPVNGKYTFKNVTEPYTIDAYFVKLNVPITPDVGDKTIPETGGTDGTAPGKATAQDGEKAGGGTISDTERKTESTGEETADRPLTDDSDKNTPEKDAPALPTEDADRAKQEYGADSTEHPFILLSALFALAGPAFAVLTAAKKRSRKRRIISAAAAIGAVAVFLLTTGWSGFILADWWTLLAAAFTAVAIICMGAAKKDNTHADEDAAK